MMDVKKPKTEAQDTEQQDAPVLPHRLTVGIESFLYLIVTMIILATIDIVHAVKSGYYPIRLEAEPKTNSLFFNLPTMLFYYPTNSSLRICNQMGVKSTETKASTRNCYYLTTTHPTIHISTHPVMR